MKLIDLRSDTVTRPSQEMREIMFAAEVGDDVYGDDPSSNELASYAAEITGKEEALYACSGTMGNLLAFAAVGKPGESLLTGTNSHIWTDEVGGFSAVTGLCPYPLNDREGIPDVSDLVLANRADGDIHHPETTILALENTHNFTGGGAISPGKFAEVAREGRRLGFHVHLDGARIFNAAVYHGVDVEIYTKEADTVQFCLSKGLGAPMGSMLCGTHEVIERARKWRKRIGGGQRQIGIAASAGLYALKNNIPRLAEDHSNARLLADLLQKGNVEVEKTANMTNMVFFKIKSERLTDKEFLSFCKEKGLLLKVVGPRRVRLVTHMDVYAEDMKEAADIIIGLMD